MKHAILETGSRTFIALEKGFHGKTLGAVQLTANQDYREPFLIDGLTVHRVRINDIAHLEQTFARTGSLAGLIFEPIQGEGGVREITPEFAQRAAALCAARGAPLIADEIQTGMGRTGTFLACEALGVTPDYVLLSKALGGGLAKISATLIRRDRHIDKFDVLHTSTYAEDDYSSGVALKALELLDADALAACSSQGGPAPERTPEPDGGVPRRHRRRPRPRADGRRRVPAAAGRFEFPAAAAQQPGRSHLRGGGVSLQRPPIRVAPTLSDPQTLRLEPSLLHLRPGHRPLPGRARRRLRETAGARRDRADPVFHRGPGRAITISTRVTSDTKFFIHDEPPYWQRELDPPPLKVAWLFHLIDADDLVSLEPDAAGLTYDERERYLRHFAPRANPLVMSSFDVQSTTGAKVRFYAIALPFTSNQMKQWLDEGNFFRVRHSIDKAIKVARFIGCDVIALGQYTSIVTRNATTLDLPHVGLTTGNSYTIALALEAIERALARARPRAGGGDAGRRRRVGKHRPDLRRDSGAAIRTDRVAGQQQAVRAAPPRGAAGAPAAGLASMPTRRRCGRRMSCSRPTNAPETVPHRRTSLPRARSCATCRCRRRSVRDVRETRPDVLVIGGGIARLPFGEAHGILGIPAARPARCTAAWRKRCCSVSKACATRRSPGFLPAEHVYRLAAMAKRHGFTLAEYKTHATMGQPT